jgi:hypothetical protein
MNLMIRTIGLARATATVTLANCLQHTDPVIDLAA